MNVPAAMSLVSATLAVAAGLLALRISRAPGSGDQRAFAVVALTAAAYALLDVGPALGAPDATALWFARAQVSMATVHVWAWIRYSREMLERRPGRAERALSAALLACAVLPLVPELVLEGLVTRPYAPLGVTYRQAVATPVGAALFAAALLCALLPLARFVLAWRAGVPHARVVAVSLFALVAFGASDSLAALGFELPQLLELGFGAPILAVAWVIATRFVEATRALEALHARLASEVEARTHELTATLDALHRSEKLAALGQFASGLAHEVNSPAAAVTANLRYAEESTRKGAFSPDAHEAIVDALASMQQINALVRKVVDAGRVAAAPESVARVAIAEVAQAAAEEARQRLQTGGTVVVEKLPAGAVRVPRDVLHQVLATIVANAAEAIPAGRPGRITIRAERVAGLVRIAIADDGAGMAPEILRRAFDPFFTTKRPGGRGAGLTLAVARRLVEGQGGALWLASAPGVGTTAYLELPEVTPEETSSATAGDTPPPAPPRER